MRLIFPPSGKRVGDSFYKFVLRLCVLFNWRLYLISANSRRYGYHHLGWQNSFDGMLCGVMGINVAHELGHKQNKASQFFFKVLLTTTLYTHFFLEHTRHHKYVGTEDPLRRVEASGSMCFGLGPLHSHT